MSSMLRLRFVGRKFMISATLIGTSAAGIYYNRVLPDLTSGHWGGPKHYSPRKATKEQIESSRNPSFHVSNDKYYEIFDKFIHFGYLMSRYIAVNFINVVIKLGMNANIYNSFHAIKDDRYEYLVDSICSREEDEALITVSNHCSTIDDPTLIGAIMPTSLILKDVKTEKLRWSLCSQEICFKNDVLGCFYRSGKVLPIKRGAGISQPQLYEFGLKIANCEWVNIFPEGKIIQSGSLGRNYFGTRSSERAQQIGTLKWGIGKLIAHSPSKMRVIPYHHLGMECVIPQKKTGELIQKRPLGGSDVILRVGDPIHFDDLIDEHEKKYGPLHRYGTSSRDKELESWRNSTKYEHELYCNITKRIQYALEALEKESINDGSHLVECSYERLQKNIEATKNYD